MGRQLELLSLCAQANPQIANILNDLSSRFTEDVMRGLNAEVDVDKKDARQVANDFLKRGNLLP
jgi:glycine betaine/choline ABC-type transport system substrate-binding protein